jgi:hypothetical protein
MNPVLIHLRPLDVATNQRVDVYVGDAGSADEMGAGGQTWEPAIGARPVLSLELMSPDLDGQVKAGQAKFTLLLRALRRVKRATELYWLGASVVIQSTGVIEGDAAQPDFQGIVTAGVPNLDTGQIDITAEVSSVMIDKNLLTGAFDGSGGLGGDAGFRGTPYPAGFGFVFNIEPVWFDATNSIGMIDGYGTCQDIVWAGEGLSTFGPRVANYPNYETLVDALKAGAIKPGQWATSVQPGQPALIALGAPSVGIVTCHARFGYDRIGSMMRRIASAHCLVPDAQIDANAFAALDAAVPYPVHYWTADQRNAKELLQALAQSVNATPLLTFANVLTVTRATRSAAVGVLDRSGGQVPRVLDWQAAAVDPPYSKIVGRTARPATVLTFDQVNYGVTLTDRGTYNPDTVYSDGDIAWDTNGASYLYFYATPAAGVPLADETHWLTQTEKPVLDWQTQIAGAGKPQNGATRNYYHGDYDPNVIYQAGDQVTNQGAIWNYIADPGQGNAPPQLPTEQNTWWQLYINADSEAALAAIAALAADNILSGIEKKTIIRDMTEIGLEEAELVQRASGLGIDTTAYVQSYSALSSYLAGLNPAWDDTSQNTVIDGPTFRARFQAYYSQREALELSTGQNVDASIAAISSDNVISKGEKGALIRDWQSTRALYANLTAASVAIANSYGVDVTAVQRTAATNAQAALDGYLGSLQPAWNDISQNTPVDGQYLRQLFLNEVNALNTLDQANQTYTTSSSASTLAQVSRISSDGWLSAAEKPDIIRDWNDIYAERGPIDAQADRLGVPRAAYDQKWQALSDYLASLRPPWNDVSQDTPINGAQFRGAFNDYEAAKTSLITAITQAAANAVASSNSVVLSSFAQGLKGFLPAPPGYDALANLVNIADGSIGRQIYARIHLDTIVPDYSGKRHVVQVHLTNPDGSALAMGNEFFDVWATYGPWGIPGGSPSLLQSRAYMLPVKQGDVVFGRSLAAQHRCTCQLFMLIMDKNGALVEATSWTGARELGGQGGDPANFNVIGGVYSVTNANSAYAMLMARVVGTGGSDPYVFLTEPAMGKLTLGQNVLPPYVDGPSAPPDADNTGTNTSADTANVNGQSAVDITNAIATANTAAAAAGATASAVQAFTNDVADNNRASPDEKKRYVGAVAGWDNDVASEVSKATSIGLSTEASAYQAAYAALRDYLVNTVRINDISTRTYFDRNQFLGYTRAFTAAATTLQNALKARAALLNASGRATTSTIGSTNAVSGIRSLNLTGFVLTQTKNGSTVTVNVSSSQYQLDTGKVLNYPSASFGGYAFSTTYYFWRDDPDLSGGSGYGSSTNVTDALAPGRVYLGYLTTMTSGGTGGGGGGGGTSGCVDPAMYVEIEGEGPVLVRDVVPGQRILCLTETLDGVEFVEVQANTIYQNLKCEIVAATGEGLVLAINTPVPHQDGSYDMAGNAWTRPVPVGDGKGAPTWEDARIEPARFGDVCRISCHERIYGAGREPGQYIWSHNAAVKP